MGLPLFSNDGLLPPGIHRCSGREFIERFCKGERRAHFTKAIVDVLDFSTSKGAAGVLVGGSFVARTETPADLDCVIIFPEESQIPERTERLSIEGTRLDIFFCARSQEKILSSFVQMFSKNRSGRDVGVVHKDLWDDSGAGLWDVIQEVDEETLEIIKRLYFNRQIVDKNNSHKALITVHGIRTHADWNAEVAHIASSNGWIFAPFTYGYFDLAQLASAKERKSIVDKFRDHIYYISDRYGCDTSVIAHSFGTYVVMKYLLGFDVPPVSIDTLILTGSILHEDLDLDQLRGKASIILNEVAPNDEVVEWAKAGTLWQEPLIGKSGTVGFTRKSDRLDQRVSQIFDHNNVIRRDVIATRWMPFLEAGRGSSQAEIIEIAIERSNSKRKP